MNRSTQIIIYYIKSVPAVGEDAPYQGKIERIVAVEPGYTPSENEIYSFVPQGVEINTILAVSLCLN